MGTPKKKFAETFVKDIRNNPRSIYTAEFKILIVVEVYVQKLLLSNFVENKLLLNLNL